MIFMYYFLVFVFSVAIVIFNKTRKEFVFVKQFRPGKNWNCAQLLIVFF